MEVGEANGNGMRLKEKTAEESSNHPNAKIWVMECNVCGAEARVNSCDAHERLCPFCIPSAAPSDGLV